MVTSITIAYFSPTGGTKRAAQLLADRFDLPAAYLDLTRPENREQRYDLTPDTLLIAACPVYLGQLPMVARLFENLMGDRTPCAVMAAYGNREYENLPAQLGAKLERQGFVCLGGIACIIPHCYLEEMGKGRPDEEDMPAFSAFAQAIMQKLDNPPYSAALLPGEAEPKRRQLRSFSKTWDEASCTYCGICAAECPTEAIDPQSMRVDPERCIVCVKCCSICPTGAWQFDGTNMRTYLLPYLEHNPVEWFV
ncbi:MAG: 4Fe-4S binding protein [Bacillota bacterium]